MGEQAHISMDFDSVSRPSYVPLLSKPLTLANTCDNCWLLVLTGTLFFWSEIDYISQFGELH
jgi:hypothetical protein